MRLSQAFKVCFAGYCFVSAPRARSPARCRAAAAAAATPRRRRFAPRAARSGTPLYLFIILKGGGARKAATQGSVQRQARRNLGAQRQHADDAREKAGPWRAWAAGPGPEQVGARLGQAGGRALAGAADAVRGAGQQSLRGVAERGILGWGVRGVFLGWATRVRKRIAFIDRYPSINPSPLRFVEEYRELSRGKRLLRLPAVRRGGRRPSPAARAHTTGRWLRRRPTGTSTCGVERGIMLNI